MSYILDKTGKELSVVQKAVIEWLTNHGYTGEHRIYHRKHDGISYQFMVFNPNFDYSTQELSISSAKMCTVESAIRECETFHAAQELRAENIRLRKLLEEKRRNR